MTDFAGGVVKVPGDDGVSGANHHASRFQPQIGAMGAVVTFGCCVGFRINVDGIVGAGLHASFATNANVGVELNDAVGALIHSCNRANAHAGRVGAVVAARHLKMATGIGKSAFFDILDPSAIDAQRHLVFGFAGGAASVTTNTTTVVYHKTIIQAGLLARTIICWRVSSASL